MISTFFYLVTLMFSMMALCTNNTEISFIAIATLLTAFVAAEKGR